MLFIRIVFSQLAQIVIDALSFFTIVKLVSKLTDSNCLTAACFGVHISPADEFWCNARFGLRPIVGDEFNLTIFYRFEDFDLLNTGKAGAAASPQQPTAVILTASFDLRFYEYMLGVVAIKVSEKY